jgi:hypothetical protein
MSPFDAVLFCTDEDILVRAEGDYPTLVPAAQSLAAGADGSIAGWVLSSPSTNFAAQGVLAGDVIFVQAIPTVPSAPAAAPAALGFAGEPLVADVVGAALNLRRPGFASGIGQPPGPVGGYTGLRFQCRTLRPQIKQVSDRIRQEINWAADADLSIPEDLTELAVLWVLADRYLDKWRSVASAGQQQGDIWGQKAKQRVTERDTLLRSLISRRRSGNDIDTVGVVPIDPPDRSNYPWNW